MDSALLQLRQGRGGFAVKCTTSGKVSRLGKTSRRTRLPLQACCDIAGLGAQLLDAEAEQLDALLLGESLPEGPHRLHALLGRQLSLAGLLLHWQLVHGSREGGEAQALKQPCCGCML